MIVQVENVPAKLLSRKNARRMRVIDEFLKSDYTFAEAEPENGDTPKQLYNGILMAIRRCYSGKVRVCWRNGRVYLVRIEEKQEEE